MKKLVLTLSLFAVAPMFAEEAKSAAATETAKIADAAKPADDNKAADAAKPADDKKAPAAETKGWMDTVAGYYNDAANKVDGFFYDYTPGSSYVSSAVNFARTHVKMTMLVVAVTTAAVVKACEGSSSEAEL